MLYNCLEALLHKNKVQWSADLVEKLVTAKSSKFLTKSVYPKSVSLKSVHHYIEKEQQN